jgi:putative tryptophan/tyrosine transport system substrate-binding protein
MRRRTFIGVAAVTFLAAQLDTRAQEARKIVRIGFLRLGVPRTEPGTSLTARSGPPWFWPAMQSLGWFEGKNAQLESRFAPNEDELPKLAADLVALNVDVIMTNGTPATKAAKHATQTIPIVFWLAADPVKNELVSNLARPEGNITGFVYGLYDEKLLEVLKAALPAVSRVAYALHPPGDAIVRAARVLNLQLQTIAVETPQDFEHFFVTARNSGADAVVIPDVPWFAFHKESIAALALKHRLPSIGSDRYFPESGGLLSYGPVAQHIERVPAQIDRILRGAKPADLPVEQPTRFDLAINLKTAKALGLTIPQSLQVLATEVIR